MSEQTSNEQTASEEGPGPAVEQHVPTASADGQNETTSNQPEEPTTDEGAPSIDNNPKEAGKVSNEKANEDLLTAARNGDVEGVKSALHNGADIGSKDDLNGETALHLASRLGYYDVVEPLLRRGADVQIKDHDGWSPLYGAVHGNHGKIAERLIESGSDVDSSDNDGWTPLMHAVYYGHESIVHLLLGQHASVKAQDDEGWTPLHYATRYGDYETVKLLLEHGPDVNAVTENGWTSLQFATRYGDLATVQMVISCNANVEIADSDGWTALHKIPFNDNEQDREKIAEELIRKGAKMTATQDDKQTPLHKACDTQCPSLVRRLLELEDPMVNAEDRGSWTALHYASRNGNGEIVGLLLQKGARSNSKVSGTDQSALALAVATLSRIWTENGASDETEAPNKTEDISETIKSAKKAVELIANKSTAVEKQFVIRQLDIRQDDKGRELDRLVNLMGMTGPKREETKLIWYAARQEYHQSVHEMLKDKKPQPAKVQERSALQVASHHGMHVVVWWLLKTADTKAADDRKEAIKLAEKRREDSLKKKEDKLRPEAKNGQKGGLIPNKLETKDQDSPMKAPSRGKERREQSQQFSDSQNERTPIDLGLTINMLKDPPPVRGMEDSYDLNSAPSSMSSGTVIHNFDATIVDFYRQDRRVDFLRRSYSVQDVIYKTVPSSTEDNAGGPEQIMEQARETLKRISPEAAKERNYSRNELQVRWIHLPANNMKWMNDLTQRVYYDKKEVKGGSSVLSENYSSLRRFLQRSWHEIKNGSSTSGFMKPSFSRDKVGKKSVGQNDEQAQATAATTTPESVQRTPETQKSASEGQEAKNLSDEDGTDQTQQSSPRMNQKSSGRESFDATALYVSSPLESFKNLGLTVKMPYVTFSKCYSHERKQQEKPNDEAKYENLISTYDRDIVHGTRSLDRFYYHSLKDTGDRDQSQVVTRALVGKEEIKEIKNMVWWPIISVDQLWLWVIDEETIVTSATHRPDGFDDPVVDRIIDRMRDDQFNGHRRPPPASVDELSKYIVRFCIDFIQTATWKSSPSEVPDNWLGKHAVSWSPKEIFSDTINTKATEEKDLFEEFRTRVRYREEQSKKKHDKRGKERSQDENQDWKAIRKAADLLHEVKDIRDEITMLQALLSQQETVWKDLLANVKLEDGKGVSDIVRDLHELGVTSQTIQTSVQELLTLEQNGISITEAVLSRDQAKESARQGKTIMVFTIVTIVFTPMSFLSSLFALNVSTFQHDSEGNLFYHPSWIYPMIFCVSIAITAPLLVLAVYVEEVMDFIGKRWRIYQSDKASSRDNEVPHTSPKAKDGSTERQNQRSVLDPGKTDSSENADPPESKEQNTRHYSDWMSQRLFRKSPRSPQGIV